MLADHVPGTQDYSGMSFEGLRAALQILAEVHPVTKTLNYHFYRGLVHSYHKPLHYRLSVYPKPAVTCQPCHPGGGGSSEGNRA